MQLIQVTKDPDLRIVYVNPEQIQYIEKFGDYYTLWYSKGFVDIDEDSFTKLIKEIQ